MKRIYVVNVIQPLFKMMLLPDDEDITYFTSEGDHTGRASNDHNNKKNSNDNNKHINNNKYTHFQS